MDNVEALDTLALLHAYMVLNVAHKMHIILRVYSPVKIGLKILMIETDFNVLNK